MLYTNRWSNTKSSAYSIEVEGLSDNVNMRTLPQAMQDEAAKISFVSRNNNVIIFECWETPTINILIDIEIDIVYPIKVLVLK